MIGQTRWYLETLPLRGEVVCDLGANVGELSEFFARAGARRVLSVEPLAENVAQIRARVAALGAADRWEVAACAVSDRRGEVLLRRADDEGVRANSAVISAEAPGALRAPCDTLAGLCPDATVVKLDIEGHEYEVLDQALPSMPGVRAWAIELHMTSRPLQGVIQQLAAHGFRVFGAGRAASDAGGRWLTAEVPPTLSWDALPVAARRADGSVFKMLHVVARR